MSLRNRQEKTEVSTSPRPQLRKEKEADVKSKEHTDSHFHLDVWLLLTVQNWVLDFGRPIYGLYVSEFFPLSLPGIGDYCHMLYNVITAFCLMKLLEKSQRPVPMYIQQLLVIFFVMGASIHLVGDSVQHRLLHSGYQLHLTVRDNPVMKNLQPQSLVESFELLHFYDEHLGHLMWYIPLFAGYIVYYFGSFGKNVNSHLSLKIWLLLIFSAIYEWYLVTEGQIFPIFLPMLFIMFVILFWRSEQGLKMDVNGRFVLYRSILTMVLVALWVFYLWDDEVLRRKYPEFLYVPEPWSYVSLYLM